MSKTKAVIFDLGGVVFSSPMQAFSKLEKQEGLEHNFLNKMIVRNGADSAWAKLEKGHLAMGPDFYQAFDQEIEEAGAPGFSSKVLMEEVSNSMGINQCMVEAISTLRENGFKVAALTNNWIEPDSDGFAGQLREHFDEFVESALVGMQKPDPEIYQLTCERLGIEPHEAVFLDDIGRNLKSAKALGMETIKVVEPEPALQALEKIVNIKLISK